MTSEPNNPRPSMLRLTTLALPGIALAAIIAVAAFLISKTVTQIPLNPIMLAVLLGAAVAAFTGMPAAISAGLNTVPRLALRIAIVLLGFQVSFSDILNIGGSGLATVLLATLTTMIATLYAGRAMGLERNTSLLIATGTSICGVAAIIAMGAAIRASARDMTYAIICITLFGLIAMVLFPLAAPLLGLDARAFGIWTGASVHEVAQVVAAGFQHSNAAGEVATVTKLSRVLLLAPVVAAVMFYLRREAPQTTPSILPWFVAGFVLAAAANSFVTIPSDMRVSLALITSALFAFALAAIGLSIDLRQFFKGRSKEMALGLFAAVWIAAISLAAIYLTR